MSEARNIIILILILLFVFVGVGVAISRIKKPTSPTPRAQKSVLELIFGDRNKVSPTPGPSATPTPAKTVVVTDSTYTFEGSTPMPTRKPTVIVQTPGMTKGGQPQNIPATGADPVVTLLALTGLASGIYLHRKV